MQWNSRPNSPSTSNEDLQEHLAAEGSALIRLSEMPRYIPAGRNGKKRHASSVYRYVFKGVRGIKLEAWRLPDGWYSSRDAWARFVERLTVAGRGTPPSPRARCAAPARRQSAVEAEIEAVRASIGRRAASAKETTAVPEPSAANRPGEGQS
jgi:hypothetical protein